MILEGTSANKENVFDYICFNHAQEHISQVFLIQLSVFRIVYLLFNTVFFLMVAIFLKLVSSFVLHEFWKLAYKTYFHQAVHESRKYKIITFSQQQSEG